MKIKVYDTLYLVHIKRNTKQWINSIENNMSFALEILLVNWLGIVTCNINTRVYLFVKFSNLNFFQYAILVLLLLIVKVVAIALWFTMQGEVSLAKEINRCSLGLLS